MPEEKTDHPTDANISHAATQSKGMETAFENISRSLEEFAQNIPNINFPTIKLPTIQSYPNLIGGSKNSSNLTGLKSVADIGLAVRIARKSKNLTQQNFADLAGVGRRFLSELESGKPTLEIGKVLQVATAAGLKLAIVNNSDG